MRKLIRHILKESSSKIRLLKVIEEEGIFSAAELVGGMDNLKRILKDEPDFISLINSLKGTLTLNYHSRKQYIEFPMKFEIVRKGVNVWNTNSWPIVNLIYDDSMFTNSEKEKFDSFVFDAINDLNIGNVDIDPKSSDMFRGSDYYDIRYANGKSYETLENEVPYEDNDIIELNRKYRLYNALNESKIIKENEEDPTQKILNFLLRRYEVKEKKVGDDEDPIIYKTLTIDMGNQDVYGMNTFITKKEQIRLLTSILMNHNVIDRFEFNKTKDNPYAQKVIRAVRQFITQVMSDKSNMNESKIVDKIKSFLGKKPLSNDDRLVNVLVKFIKENYSIDFSSNDEGEITYYETDDTGNWIYPPIMRYFPKYKRLEYNWDFAKDIHSVIGDNRLLHLDSEMMGKIFEKLFNKKVNKVFGYSRL